MDKSSVAVYLADAASQESESGAILLNGEVFVLRRSMSVEGVSYVGRLSKVFKPVRNCPSVLVVSVDEGTSLGSITTTVCVPEHAKEES